MRYKKGYRYVIEKGRSIQGCVAAVECSGHGAWKENGWVDDGSYTAVKLVAELSLMRRNQKLTQKQGAGVKDTQLCRLSDLLIGLEEPAESVELRFRVLGGPSSMSDVTHKALLSLREVALSVGKKGYLWKVEEINYEGLRVNFDFTVQSSDENSDSASFAPDCVTIDESGSFSAGSVPSAASKLTGWVMLRPSLHEPILSMQIESDQTGGAAAAARILMGTLGGSVGFSLMESLMDIAPLRKLAME
jgi:phosphomannomutase